MSITETMQRHAKEFLKEALASGTWKRIRTGVYERSTGEIVSRKGGSWDGAGKHWQSAYAAMSHIDFINKGKRDESGT